MKKNFFVFLLTEKNKGTLSWRGILKKIFLKFSDENFKGEFAGKGIVDYFLCGGNFLKLGLNFEKNFSHFPGGKCLSRS